MNDLYLYKNYKNYVKFILDSKDNDMNRKVIAEHLNCHASFVTQVLNKDLDFSPEQALKFVQLLKLNNEAQKYFMSLVMYGRAGTDNLKKFYQKEIDQMRESKLSLSEVVEVNTDLSEDFYLKYFSSWHYAAIHVITMTEKKVFKKDIIDKVDLSEKLINEALAFLEKNKLIIKNEDGSFYSSPKRIHLDKKSPLVTQHHTNWRLKAIESSSDKSRKNTIHYSSVVAISEKTMEQIHKKILETLKNVEQSVKNTKYDNLYSICMDFFKV